MTLLPRYQEELAQATKQKKNIIRLFIICILLEFLEVVGYWFLSVYLQMRSISILLLVAITGISALVLVYFYLRVLAQIEQLREYIQLLSPKSETKGKAM